MVQCPQHGAKGTSVPSEDQPLSVLLSICNTSGDLSHFFSCRLEPSFSGWAITPQNLALGSELSRAVACGRRSS